MTNSVGERHSPLVAFSLWWVRVYKQQLSIWACLWEDAFSSALVLPSVVFLPRMDVIHQKSNASTYIAEMAHPHWRGPMTSMYNTCW